MTETQIKSFLSVARLKSYTAAANEMYISQPAVSRSVKSLEAEFGTELFFENGREITLTKEGERLFSFFSRYISELDEIKAAIAGKGVSESAPTIIGCPDTWNPNIMLSQIKFAPERNIELECCNLRELIFRLQRGRIDGAITHDFGLKLPQGIVSETVAQTNCGIFYARKHFPAYAAFTDFEDTEFLCYDEEIQKLIAAAVRNVSGDKSYIPKTRNVGRQETAVFQMKLGKGVMFFSEWDAAASDPGLGYFRFQGKLDVKYLHRVGDKRAGEIIVSL